MSTFSILDVINLREGAHIDEQNYLDLIYAAINDFAESDIPRALIECASIIHNFQPAGKELRDYELLKKISDRFKDTHGVTDLGRFLEFWYLIEQIVHRTERQSMENAPFEWKSWVCRFMIVELTNTTRDCDRMLRFIVRDGDYECFLGSFDLRQHVINYVCCQFMFGHADPPVIHPKSRRITQDLLKAVWAELAERCALSSILSFQFVGQRTE